MSSPSSSHQKPPGKPRRTFDVEDTTSNAAWSIVSYVLSGILFWGAVGWLLDRWLFGSASTGTVLLLPIGVVVGAAAGGYLGYMRFTHAQRVTEQVKHD